MPLVERKKKETSENAQKQSENQKMPKIGQCLRTINCYIVKEMLAVQSCLFFKIGILDK